MPKQPRNQATKRCQRYRGNTHKREYMYMYMYVHVHVHTCTCTSMGCTHACSGYRYFLVGMTTTCINWHMMALFFTALACCKGQLSIFERFLKYCVNNTSIGTKLSVCIHCYCYWEVSIHVHTQCVHICNAHVHIKILKTFMAECTCDNCTLTVDLFFGWVGVPGILYLVDGDWVASFSLLKLNER